MPQLSPWHLANDSNKEVQRQNHFEVQITDVMGELLALAVNSVDFPTVTVPQIELQHGNSTVKVAGKVEFDDISLEVKDFIGDDVAGQLALWMREVYNPASDEIGLATDYKRDGYLYEYAPDGSNERQWNLYGVWPTSMEAGEGNYDGGEQKPITMTLSVDKAERIGGQ